MTMIIQATIMPGITMVRLVMTTPVMAIMTMKGTITAMRPR
ncbi:hypothetical protein [Devosia yakushimensis]|nr:hypothetical protein [Devosia yakushimensis]